MKAKDEWIRDRERRRAAISWSSAIGAYAAFLLVAALLSNLDTSDRSGYSGPVMVRLGSPKGAEIEFPGKGEEIVPPPKESAPPEAPPPPATAESPSAALPDAKDPSAPASKPASVAPQKPARPATATTPAATTAAASTAPTSTAAPEPIALRGSEKGNSYDFSMASSAGKAGRSLYVPIWLYMQLPRSLPGLIYESIPDLGGIAESAAKRKAIFETFYEKLPDGSWRLKGLKQPDYESRPDLWAMLEDAGYDVKNAEYKAGKRLRPVEILFRVSASAFGSGANPALEEVVIESGSGYPDIDEDVLYGFRKAGFFNSGTTSVTGRFSYRF